MRRILTLLFRTLLGLLGLGLVLVVAALVAIRIPSVQTNVAQRIAAVLSQKLGQRVSIARVDVRPFSRVLLDGLRVLDRRGNEVLSVARTDADIALFSVLDPRHLHIGTLTLTEPRFALRHLAGQPDSTTFDVLRAAIGRLTGPSDTTKKAPFDFKIARVALENGHFEIEKEGVPRAPTYGRTVDYNHLQVDSVYADISQITLADTVRLRLDRLRAVETPSRTHLRELTSTMQLGPHFWQLDDLTLRVNRSVLRNYLRFDYRVFTNFTDYNDSMKTTGHLRNTRVYSEDIAKFAPALHGLHEAVTVSGDYVGYTRDFHVKNLDVRYGSGTRLRAKTAHADNLPNYRESYIDLRLLPSVVEPRDLAHFLPKSANTLVQRLGRTALKGDFTGFYNDFVANADFQTAIGRVVTDVNLKTKTTFDRATYEGHVTSTDFQLGRFLGDETVVRDVTLSGAVAGTGFVPPLAKGRADIKVQRLWLNGYHYQNLGFKGTYDGLAFGGHVTAADPNVRLVADGDINLTRAHQQVNLRGRLAHANLQALGLSTVPFVVSTTANVHIGGVQLDSLIGYARLRNSDFARAGQRLHLDTLDVTSTRNRLNQRAIGIHSEALNAAASGTFNTSDVVRDGQTLIAEYRLNFEGNAAATAAYYQRKRQRAQPVYQVDLKVRLKRANPVLQLFLPDLAVADNSLIDGSFRNGETSIFQVGGHLDSLRYGPVNTVNNEFDFLTSKLPYKPDVLAQVSVTSDRQTLPGLGRTERFVVEGVWEQQRINFSTSLAQTGTQNKAVINGALAFLPRAVEIVFRKSGLNLLGEDWTIAPDNSIRISDYGREFDVKNLTLSNGRQFVGAQGFISPDATKPPLQLAVKDFELTTLRSLTGQDLAGRLNAEGTVSGIYGPLTINSTVAVDSLMYDRTLIGDVAGRSDWDNAAGQLRVNLAVTRANQPVLTVTGGVAPGSKTQQLDLTGTLTDTPIVLAQPFLGTLFSHLGGTGRGDLHLSGMFGAMNLTGGVDVKNGRLRFDYLGTTYTFADRIDFTMNSISFRNVALRDPLGNVGTVDGVVSHHQFQDMRLIIGAEFRKLQVLNTTRKDNDLYFGTAYASGTARVTGPVSDLRVDVRATSEAGTRLSLPLDNAAKAQKAGYIRFVNNNVRPDTVITKKAVVVRAEDKVDLSGVQLNFNLTITPDAYVEILLDESTGDIIRGTAAGQLRLNIDTRGDFNMYGQVEIVRGAYNFTLQGLVNKEFVVRPGGLITWNGDPLAGEMSLAATYTQRTSLAPILGLGTSSTGTGTNTAVVPVTAVMNLSGPLLLPVIRLGLEFNDAPGALQGDLSAFTASLRNDEQELNRQVFSLLLFKQLAPQGSFTQISIKGQDNTVQNSLGQVLSTQLGLLTSQIDQNLEIDFNINGLTPDQLQALQVRLSYSFLGGRLRVTREGGFTSTANAVAPGTTGAPGTNPNTAGQASLLGDLSLEYYLRADGRFRAKLRYETTPRDLETVNQPRAGLSLLHTEQFDTFGELFRRESPKKRDLNTQKAREGKQVLNVDEDPRTVL